MLSGTAPDAVTVDRAVTIAKQFGAEVINSVQGPAAAAGHAGSAFRRGLAQRRSRELGINWNVVTRNVVARRSAPAAWLSGATSVRRHRRPDPRQRRPGRRDDPGAGGAAARAPPRRAEPDRALRRHRKLPRRRRVSHSGRIRPTTRSRWNGRSSASGLAFTPTVLDNGVINLKIEPEVSQLDPNNTIQIGSIRIPSLTVRRANTTVELRDGQSFAIAGLLQTITTTDQNQLPWLGDVPVLGALLRSASFQKQETDLAIIITPHLVQPARPGDALQDAARQYGDRQRRRPVPARSRRAHAAPGARGNSPIVQAYKPVGHILDLPKGAVCDGAVERTARTWSVVPALAVAAMLGGCADIYYDRRDTVTLSCRRCGRHATRSPTSSIRGRGPPPTASIETDGQRMQRAVERYRTNKTTPLLTTSTSSTGYAAHQGRRHDRGGTARRVKTNGTVATTGHREASATSGLRDANECDVSCRGRKSRRARSVVSVVMVNGRSVAGRERTRVVVLTADPANSSSPSRATFGGHSQIDARRRLEGRPIEQPRRRLRRRHRHRRRCRCHPAGRFPGAAAARRRGSPAARRSSSSPRPSTRPSRASCCRCASPTS